MSISSLGIGSGIDISSLVSQLVSAERSPQEALLSNRSSSANAELSALGRVRSSLGALKTAAENLTNADLFSATRASSGDEAALLVSSSNEAVAGSYDARVLQLASAHKLHSMAYADADTDVGYGDLTLSRGSDSGRRGARGEVVRTTCPGDADKSLVQTRRAALERGWTR